MVALSQVPALETLVNADVSKWVCRHCTGSRRIQSGLVVSQRTVRHLETAGSANRSSSTPRPVQVRRCGTPSVGGGQRWRSLVGGGMWRSRVRCPDVQSPEKSTLEKKDIYSNLLRLERHLRSLEMSPLTRWQVPASDTKSFLEITRLQGAFFS